MEVVRFINKTDKKVSQTVTKSINFWQTFSLGPHFCMQTFQLTMVQLLSFAPFSKTKISEKVSVI